jgi:asparagine synthase (glutamine-hydrolysing)
MCGIAGIFSLTGRPVINAEARIRKMNSLLHHRGPDDEGFSVLANGTLVLGNTRLAITGPKDPIELPTLSHDRQSVITFNGEIFDFQFHKENMEADGIRFRTQTDTEVLNEGLRHYGNDFLTRIDGMWAFACYNFESQKLTLSRDVLGERHVYYRIIGDEFIFASEALPILADRNKPETIDFPSIITSFRYGSAPPGLSAVAGLKRLGPGHNLTIDKTGEMEISRYRKLQPEKWAEFSRPDISEEAVIDKFEELMAKAATNRVPPHVPFVSTLSGGLDSALVVAFSSEFGKRQIDTLFGQSAATPGQNEGEEFDEYETSKLTSSRMGTNHHFVQMNNDECVPILKSIADNSFEGLFDSAVAPFEMLARTLPEMKRKVMLISDGPDELLGGYGVDRKAYENDQTQKNFPLKYLALKTASAKYPGRRIMSKLGYGSSVIQPGHETSPFHCIPQHQFIGPDILSRTVEPGLVEASATHYGILPQDYADTAAGMDHTQIRALSYAAISLPEMFNLRTDKGFLRASVECRLPFQSPDLVDFMISLPAKFRFGKGDTTKYLLRKVVERHIGPKVAWRSKHGFSAQLFDSKNVWNKMRFEETIQDSSLFEDLPFKPGVKDRIFTRPYRKFVWPMYSLAKIHQQLSTGSYNHSPS